MKQPNKVAPSLVWSGARHLRVLGELLRAARRRAGLSGMFLAASAGMSQPRLSRIELGQAEARGEEVDALLREMSPPLSERQQIERIVNLMERPAEWMLAIDPDVVTFHRDIWHGLFADWDSVRMLHTHVVPGVLQTLPYMQAIFSGASWSTREQTHGRATDDSIAGEVMKVRLEAQRRTFENACSLRVVIFDSAFTHGPIAGAEMAAQCNHIAQMARLPTVDVAIIPGYRPVPFVETSFSLINDRTVLLDTEVGVIRCEAEMLVEMYRDRFDLALERALRGEDAIEHLYAMATRLATQDAAGAVDLRG